LLERVRAADHLSGQVGVGELAPVAVRLALPVEGDAVAVAGLDVAVEAVVGDVELAAEVPLRVREVPLVELRERLEPRHALAAFTLPERLEAVVVDRGLRVCLRGELGGRRVAPLLEEEGVDGLVRLGCHVCIFAHRGGRVRPAVTARAGRLAWVHPTRPAGYWSCRRLTIPLSTCQTRLA
jgi:hypothetical protein